MKTKRDETHAAWAEHLKKWRQSGQTRLEYCRESGIKDHQLRYWASRLAEGGTSPGAFAQVVADRTAAVPTLGGAARLVLPSGAIIEFSSAAEPSWIGRVAQEVCK